jgi:hypothetical protein
VHLVIFENGIAGVFDIRSDVGFPEIGIAVDDVVFDDEVIEFVRLFQSPSMLIPLPPQLCT